MHYSPTRYHPSICPSIHLSSICPLSTHPCIYQSSIHPSSHPTHLPIHLSIHPSIYLFIHPYLFIQWHYWYLECHGNSTINACSCVIRTHVYWGRWSYKQFLVTYIFVSKVLWSLRGVNYCPSLQISENTTMGESIVIRSWPKSSLLARVTGWKPTTCIWEIYQM